MIRRARKVVAVIAFGIGLTCFASHFVLFFRYVAEGSVPINGAISYYIYNHGPGVRITEAHAVGLSVLIRTFIIGAVISFIIAPKSFSRQMLIGIGESQPRFRIRYGIEPLTTADNWIMFLAAIITCSVIVIFGTDLENFVSTRHLVTGIGMTYN